MRILLWPLNRFHVTSISISFKFSFEIKDTRSTNAFIHLSEFPLQEPVIHSSFSCKNAYVSVGGHMYWKYKYLLNLLWIWVKLFPSLKFNEFICCPLSWHVCTHREKKKIQRENCIYLNVKMQIQSASWKVPISDERRTTYTKRKNYIPKIDPNSIKFNSGSTRIKIVEAA